MHIYFLTIGYHYLSIIDLIKHKPFENFLNSCTQILNSIKTNLIMFVGSAILLPALCVQSNVYNDEYMLHKILILVFEFETVFHLYTDHVMKLVHLYLNMYSQLNGVETEIAVHCFSRIF
eukprot:481348_1